MPRDLQSVVKIMKTISASNIREYEQAVESLKEYNKTIEMGLQIVMRNKPEELLTARAREEKKASRRCDLRFRPGIMRQFQRANCSLCDR